MARWLTGVALAVICGSAHSQDPQSRTSDLIDRLEDPERRRAAITKLVERQGDGVDQVIDLLQTTRDPETRSAALQVLRQLPDVASTTVPMLVNQLDRDELQLSNEILDCLVDLIAAVPAVNETILEIRRLMHDPEREPGTPHARDMHWLIYRLEARVFADRWTLAERVLWLRSQTRFYENHISDLSIIERTEATRIQETAALIAHDEDAGVEHLKTLAKALRVWDPRSAAVARAHLDDVPILVDAHQPSESLEPNKKLLDVEIEYVAQGIAAAMLTLDPDHPLSHAAHCTRLAHREARIRAEAAREIGTLGRHAQAYVPQLTELTSDPDPRVAREATTVLGMIGEPARVAIPRLEELAESGSPEQQAIARAALRQIRRALPVDIPMPESLIAAEDSETFEPDALRSAIALTRQTTKHRARLIRFAGAQLQRATSDDDRWLAHQLHAAALIDPQVEPETLIALIRGDTAVVTGRIHSGTWLDAALLAQAAEQLGERDDVDDLGVDALGEVLNATSGLRGSEAYRRYQRERLACAEALTKIDRDEIWTTQAYGALLAHPDPDTTIRAIQWLATHGPGSQMPQMLRVLRTKDERVRREIVIAMGLVGHRAQGALPHLERFARGDDKVLARLAETSIRQIRSR